MANDTVRTLPARDAEPDRTAPPARLTAAQAKIYGFICDYRRQRRGRSPSYREITRGVGRRYQTVFDDITELARKRYIHQEPGMHRSIVPLVRPADVLLVEEYTADGAA